MFDRRYPICSIQTPPCIGREVQLAQLISSLTKPTPDHVQIVGPRFVGKTVLLKSLMERLKGYDDLPYTATLYWDLAHQGINDDNHFFRLFSTQLENALCEKHPDYAEHLRQSLISEISFSDIAEVFDAIKGDEGKVLVILDGFDRVVVNGRLTRNLWDELRELAIKPSLRLVTATRKRLSELIRNPETETSPFWNIFNPTPLRLSCFDDQDIDAVLGCVPELHLEKGARNELLNATNAAPFLMLEVLNVLVDSGRKGHISPEDMHSICNSAYNVVRDRLHLQWKDCTPTAQDLFRQVREGRSIARQSAALRDAEMLIELGFVQTSGNKLQRANRLLGFLLDEEPNEGSSLVRLFSGVADYQTNLRTVFEHRIAQIHKLDATLERYLKRGIEDIPDHPDVFLTHIRGLIDKVFELIWQAEIPNKRIPSAWMAIWKRNEERRVDEWETRFPQGLRRVQLLNLMTGTDKSDPCARRITKETYVLMSAVYTFGDFGQHQNGAPIQVGTGYSALHLCIELVSTVTRELQCQ